MRPWWVTFYSGRSYCVMADTVDEAANTAARHGSVERVQSLPYPASPMLEGTHNSYITCRDPQKCAGWTSCRRPVACSE